MVFPAGEAVHPWPEPIRDQLTAVTGLAAPDDL
jgi:hypothetical protein